MKNIKILYAEDDATLSFLTKDNLEQNNYEVFHFSDGKQCLENFNNNTFDICIFDINEYWKVAPSALKSQGKNSPFNGLELAGKVKTTLVHGQVVYQSYY